MPATAQTAFARKIAAHVGISWESFSDYAAFVSSVQGELMRCIVDAENLQLYGGTGDANNQVNGLTTNANILTLSAVGAGSPAENFTDISAGIAALRNGPALATCDLILTHPETWAALRVQKDGYGRFLTDPDPTVEQANTVFGVDVVVSTQFNAGQAVLMDTSIYGRAVIREPIITRMGYSGTDFTQNIVRYVSEERITQTIERPQAILLLKGLPTTAPAVAETASAKK
jgi:HK97 family phage major capsid protein